MHDISTDFSPSSLPRHVAVIMDGNGRWAKTRRLPRAEGHRRGVEALDRVVEAAVRIGVPALTVFAFSSENWRRPEAEVSMLMRLFASGLARWEKPLADAGVRLRVIGEKSAFPETVQRAIERTEKATETGSRMHLNIAANYGGRWDVLQAAQAAVAAGEALTPESISGRLSTAADGEVDLLIRTGGERRVSNFLLWQAAYAELYFDDALWPDWGEADFLRAISWYVGRERRFGMTSEQVLERRGESN